MANAERLFNIEELGKQIGQVGLPEQERLFVVDQEGQILYSQDYSQIMTNRKDFRIIEDIRQEGTEIIKFQGVRYVISTVKSEKQPWLYISVVPLEKYGDEMERVNRILFVFYSIGLLVMLIIAFVISINTYEPLKVIMSLMENPREWLNQPKNQRLKASEATNELNYIMKNISVSYDSRQELEAELKKRIGILNKAKTYALQTQINPHFLFNTLETINWIAIRLLKGRNDISMLITELSKLLRISLESEQQLVSLQDEICNAETYIEIIKIRYSNRISFSWEVDDGVLDRMVPKLSLQPIIENAVQHGMKANQAGVIRITAKPIQGELVIEVRDEGVGMEQDKVSQLNEELRVVSEELTGKHIGLKNVNQRIRLIFGHTYGLRVSSVRNKGTVVTIHIPAIEQ